MSTNRRMSWGSMAGLQRAPRAPPRSRGRPEKARRPAATTQEAGFPPPPVRFTEVEGRLWSRPTAGASPARGGRSPGGFPGFRSAVAFGPVPTPRLQLALDFVDLHRAVKVAEEAVRGGVDWIEVGTPLLKAEGLRAVRTLRSRFPDVPIVCDAKPMDAGR